MDIIREAINDILDERSLINEEFRGNDFYVYHVAREETLSSLFKFGFEAYYTASKVGNAYGRGVYSTFTLDSSIKNAQRGEYGKVILRCKVRSLDKFLIWDKKIASQFYGNEWRVSNQLNFLCPKRTIEKLKTMTIGKHFWSDGGNAYDNIISYNSYTSQNAHAADWASKYDGTFNRCFDGLIFTGPHDGNVAVIRNFKNVYPIEYSLDYGKSWKSVKGDVKFKDYVLNDVDLKYEVGSLYDEVPFAFENDFARVKKNGKYNYLYKETYKNGVISPVWFDNGALTFTSKGDCLVLLDNIKYTIHYRKDTDEFFVLDKDNQFLCYLSDFEGYLSNSDEEDSW